MNGNNLDIFINIRLSEYLNNYFLISYPIFRLTILLLIHPILSLRKPELNRLLFVKPVLYQRTLFGVRSDYHVG